MAAGRALYEPMGVHTAQVVKIGLQFYAEPGELLGFTAQWIEGPDLHVAAEPPYPHDVRYVGHGEVADQLADLRVDLPNRLWFSPSFPRRMTVGADWSAHPGERWVHLDEPLEGWTRRASPDDPSRSKQETAGRMSGSTTRPAVRQMLDWTAPVAPCLSSTRVEGRSRWSIPRRWWSSGLGPR
jgi:hypothetical protein